MFSPPPLFCFSSQGNEDIRDSESFVTDFTGVSGAGGWAPSSVPQIVKEGWLTKSNPKGRYWHRRYIVLTDEYLRYYTGAEKRDRQLKKEVSLAEAEFIEGFDCDATPATEHAFTIAVPGRHYYFCTATAKELKQWTEAVHTALHLPYGDKADAANAGGAGGGSAQDDAYMEDPSYDDNAGDTVGGDDPAAAAAVDPVDDADAIDGGDSGLAQSQQGVGGGDPSSAGDRKDAGQQQVGNDVSADGDAANGGAGTGPGSADAGPGDDPHGASDAKVRTR